MTPVQRLATLALTIGLAVPLGACGAPSVATRVEQGGPAATASPATPLASVVVRGGRCVDGECREQVLVTYGGSWTYARGDADPVEGTVEASRQRALLRAVRDTRLASAPAFVGTCPTAYDGSETVLRWSPGPSLDDVEVSSCERVLSADDPLVVALGELLAEVRPDAP